MPGLLQIRSHGPHHVGRDGEADADRAARRRDNGTVHANHLAGLVEQRTAGIALIDRCVDLNELVIRTRANIAALRRHDARGHGAAEAERIAHGNHPFARTHRGAVTEFDIRQSPAASVHLQHSQVGALVAADDLRLQFRAIVEHNADGLGIFHHMVVGDHGTGRTDNEAGTARFDDTMTLWLPRHEAHRALGTLCAGLHLDGDRDNGRLYLSDKIRKIRQMRGCRRRIDRRGGSSAGRMRGQDGGAGQRAASEQHSHETQPQTGRVCHKISII